MTEMNLGALMQQAQQLREQMECLQKGLADQIVEGTAGGGMVTTKVSGALKVTQIQIDPTVLGGEDQEMLQDLIVAAVNNGLDKARELTQEKMGAMLPPGMLPPNFGP
ncbi:MAG: YbaB/EbfC family nucleoid-associated protein [Nannocystaceae bacterium]